MAAMTLSNHVLSATGQGDTHDEKVCIEMIIWRGATDAAHLMEVNDQNGKSVLEPVRAGSITQDREIRMYGKWANGLNLVDCDSLTQVDFYLRET